MALNNLRFVLEGFSFKMLEVIFHFMEYIHVCGDDVPIIRPTCIEDVNAEFTERVLANYIEHKVGDHCAIKSTGHV